MKWREAFYGVSLLAVLSLWAQASGLSTTFASVLVTDVPVGKPRVIDGPEGRGLVLKNLGDGPVTVYAQALQPAKLKAGSEPMADLSWVNIVPASLVIPPHQEGTVRVTVTIPARDEYKGRLFQVTLWSRAETREQKGMSYNAALLSTLRIRTLP